MKGIDNSVLEKVVKSSIESLGEHLKKIYLFGSKARGDDTEESDYDFLLLTDLTSKEFRRLRAEISASLDITTDIDLININDSVKFTSYLYLKARKEGVLLYE